MKMDSLDIPAIKFGVIFISETEEGYHSKLVPFERVDGLTFNQLLGLDLEIGPVTDMKLVAYIDLSNGIDNDDIHYLLSKDIKFDSEFKAYDEEVSNYFFGCLSSAICDDFVAKKISPDKIYATFASRYMGDSNEVINQAISLARKKTYDEYRKYGHHLW